MTIKVMVMSQEDSSYDSKGSTKGSKDRKQVTLSCVDMDDSKIRLKDTIDIVLGEEQVKLIPGDLVGERVEFHVNEIRPPGYGTRLRFSGQFVAKPDGKPLPKAPVRE